MEIHKEKIHYKFQFCFDKGNKTSRVADIVNCVYCLHTIKVDNTKFWFRLFCPGSLDIKDTAPTERPITENVSKILEMIEVDRHVSCRSIA